METNFDERLSTIYTRSNDDTATIGNIYMPNNLPYILHHKSKNEL